jgi:hypothetical protein
LLLRCTAETQGNILDKYSQIKTHADDVGIMGRRLKVIEPFT